MSFDRTFDRTHAVHQRRTIHGAPSSTARPTARSSPKLDSYGVLNARIGVRGELRNADWSASLWANNALDDTYFLSLSRGSYGEYAGQRGLPRSLRCHLARRFLDDRRRCRMAPLLLVTWLSTSYMPSQRQLTCPVTRRTIAMPTKNPAAPPMASKIRPQRS